MKLKKYFWIIILAAGILTLISLITPALYIRIHLFSDPGTQEFWMWGLYSYISLRHNSRNFNIN